MKDLFVADASVGIAWALPSQSSPETDRLLEEVISGTSFVAPSLWMFEVANTLLKLMRRRRITSAQCDRARQNLSLLAPTMDDEGPRKALDTIFLLANEHRLTVYDGAYLELAIRRGLPLASRDSDLNRAAKACGIRTLL